jgi:hypothetical protein
MASSIRQYATARASSLVDISKRCRPELSGTGLFVCVVLVAFETVLSASAVDNAYVGAGTCDPDLGPAPTTCVFPQTRFAKPRVRQRARKLVRKCNSLDGSESIPTIHDLYHCISCKPCAAVVASYSSTARFFLPSDPDRLASAALPRQRSARTSAPSA